MYIYVYIYICIYICIMYVCVFPVFDIVRRLTHIVLSLFYTYNSGQIPPHRPLHQELHHHPLNRQTNLDKKYRPQHLSQHLSQLPLLLKQRMVQLMPRSPRLLGLGRLPVLTQEMVGHPRILVEVEMVT